MSEAAIEPGAETGEADAEQLLADAASASDGESADKQKPEEPTKPATGATGFPASTPVAQMTMEEREAYWRFNARKHEEASKKNAEAAKRNADAAKKYAEYEDGQKTELQRLTERAEAAERERDEERRGRARLMAAATHNLSAGLLDRLGGSSEDEINETAKALSEEIESEVARRLPDLIEAEVAKRLADLPKNEPPTSGRQRPVEALTPGAMPANSAPVDGNAFLRRLAGRET